MLAFSDFVADSLLQHPEWWRQLTELPPQPDEWRHYADWLNAQLQPVSDEAALMRELRLFRRRMMVRIARMQTTGASSTEASLQQLSALAEALIVAARDWLWQACCVEFGTCNAAGEPQPLLILAWASWAAAS